MRTIVASVVVLLPTLGAAQQPRRITLPPHDARFEQPFGGAIGVRELSDGRVVVSDPNDLGLVVADFRTQSTKPISRKGGGPGEYGRAARIFQIGGDSTIMPDLMQRRWLILDGDRVAVTVPPDNPTVKSTQGLFLGADVAGYVMREEAKESPVGSSVINESDSSYLVRYHRSTGRSDTLTRLARRPTAVTRQTNAKGETSAMSMRVLRLRVGESYVLHPDGWLALIRIKPFRVDWRAPDGKWTLGAPLPVPVIRMSDKEKKASLARTARSQAQNPSSTPLPPQLQTPDDDWPDVMPPYIQSAPYFSPDGDVLFRRQPSADFPGNAYYAVDRGGRLLGILELKDNEQLIGWGAKSVYIVESDADDLKYLRRHPWPRTVLRPG